MEQVQQLEKKEASMTKELNLNKERFEDEKKVRSKRRRTKYSAPRLENGTCLDFLRIKIVLFVPFVVKNTFSQRAVSAGEDWAGGSP